MKKNRQLPQLLLCWPQNSSWAVSVVVPVREVSTIMGQNTLKLRLPSKEERGSGEHSTKPMYLHWLVFANASHLQETPRMPEQPQKAEIRNLK